METTQNNKFEKFEKLIQEIMEKDKSRGIAVKAFYKSGQIIYEKYFGLFLSNFYDKNDKNEGKRITKK